MGCYSPAYSMPAPFSESRRADGRFSFSWSGFPSNHGLPNHLIYLLLGEVGQFYNARRLACPVTGHTADVFRDHVARPIDNRHQRLFAPRPDLPYMPSFWRY